MGGEHSSVAIGKDYINNQVNMTHMGTKKGTKADDSTNLSRYNYQKRAII